ncbi:MAG: CsgE family curli-type amyloid fiber assembly protein, partial [Duganella sp.]
MFLRVMFFTATAVFAVRAMAASATMQAAAPRADGVVTVQTITTAGHDFSQHFLAAWRDMEGSEQYTLALRERPSARFGSEVSIDFAQRNVLQLRLPPSRALLRDMATSAAEQVWATVL